MAHSSKNVCAKSHEIPSSGLDLMSLQKTDRHIVSLLYIYIYIYITSGWWKHVNRNVVTIITCSLWNPVIIKNIDPLNRVCNLSIHS